MHKKELLKNVILFVIITALLLGSLHPLIMTQAQERYQKNSVTPSRTLSPIASCLDSEQNNALLTSQQSSDASDSPSDLIHDKRNNGLMSAFDDGLKDCSAPFLPSPVIKGTVKNSFKMQTKLSEKPTMYNPGTILVKLKPKATYDVFNAETALQEIRLIASGSRYSFAPVLSAAPIFSKGMPQEKTEGDLSRWVIVHVGNDTNISEEVSKYSDSEYVEIAQPDYIMEPCLVPNDPYYSSSGSWGQSFRDMYGLHLIHASDAWNVTNGSSDTIVAVVDSGVDYTHGDIQGNMWINPDEIPNNGIDDDHDGFVDNIYGADFANNDGNPMDGHGHGTHCAGTIAAVGNNSIGVVGVNWRAKIMAVKGLSDSGSGSSAVLADALRWAADQGARVLSNSWGPSGRSPSNPVIEDAVRYAYGLGCVVVFAAGNSNDNVAYYSPANMDEVIAVAATNNTDQKAYFSNWGDKVDVCAPGVDILSLRANHTDMYGGGGHIVGGKYYRSSGTSMACPHVAGLAALILAKNNSLNNEMVKTIICHSVDAVSSPGHYIGSGRINASAALHRDPALAQLNISHWSDVKGSYDINGTAWGGHFQYYVVEYGNGTVPDTWTELVNSTVPKQHEVLATLDTTSLTDGVYTIRLRMTSTDGDYEDSGLIVVNNENNLYYVNGSNIDGPWNGTLGHPYRYIQEAVDASGDGDTVFVCHGIYDEDVVIDRSLSLLGENLSSTTIENEVCVEIYADNVTVSNFSINCFLYYGIYIGSSNHDIVSYNNLTGFSYYSIMLSGSSNNTLSNNTFKGNSQLSQVYVNVESNNNTISHNNITSAGPYGIAVYESRQNNIFDNFISTRYDGYTSPIGIYLRESSNNSFYENEMRTGGFYIVGSTRSDFTHTIDTSNTINGKGIYYLINTADTIIPGGYGQVILVNCSRCTVSHLDLSNCTIGVELAYSSNTSVDSNIISGDYMGAYLVYSDYNNITTNAFVNDKYGIYVSASNYTNISSHNTFTGNESYTSYGIYLLASNSSTVFENALNNLTFGLRIRYSSSNVVEGNIIQNNTYGTVFEYSPHNTCVSNHFLDNEVIALELAYANNTNLSNNILTNNGFFIAYSYHNIVDDNMVNGHPVLYLENESNITTSDDAGQVILVRCDNITIQGQEITNASVGVEIWETSNGTLTNNVISGNSMYGILLYNSSNITISQNTITNATTSGGINLYYNNRDNTIYQNTISHTYYAVYINNADPISDNNIISENLIENNTNGILLRISNNNTISNNMLYNTHFDALTIVFDDYSSVLPANNNTIVGNTFFNTGDKGIYLFGTKNTTVTGNIFENASIGICLTICESNNISENSIMNTTTYGIYMYDHSSSNLISGNTLENASQDGIYIYYYSNENTISGNTISNSSENGIHLTIFCFNNTIIENTLSHSGEYGVNISKFIDYYDWYSNGSSIFYNNFIDNAHSAYDDCSNIWDNGYPSGGNYWSEYSASDDCSGAYQNVTGSDNIGDHPYNMTGGSNQDRYPLMYPFENYVTLKITAPSHVNEDETFTITISSLVGGRVSGAIVEFNDQGAVTDLQGLVSFAAPSVTTNTVYQILVSKTNYTGNSTTILVKNIETDGGGDGGYTPQGPSVVRNKPTAHAGGPYFGFVNIPVHFDGSKSNMTNGTIRTYLWNFGDGSNASGKTTTHVYTRPGAYIILLTVTSNTSESETNQTTAIIRQTNRAPTPPTINGTPIGHKNTSYRFTVVSTDADNDSLQYRINWGDSITNTSMFLPNGTQWTINHSWTTAKKYTITVTVTDHYNNSTTTRTMLIDTVLVENLGYLIDSNGDGTYDIFYSYETQNKTAVGQQQGKYLIDTNGDGKWEFSYDLTSLTPYTQEVKKGTPGFEFLFLLFAVAFILFWKQKRTIKK